MSEASTSIAKRSARHRPAPLTRSIRLRDHAAIARLGIVSVLLGVVEIAVWQEWISPLFVSRPTEVLRVIAAGLVDGTYPALAGRTLFAVTAAFVAATVVGGTGGYLLWRYPKFGAAYEPALLALFSSPIVLAYPVFLVVFRRNPIIVVLLGFLAGVLPITILTRKAIAAVPRVYGDVASVLRLTRRQELRQVMLPAAMPGIASGLRLGLIYTLLNVLAVEFVTGLGGLGAEISNAYALLRAPRMYAALAFTQIISVAFVYAVDRLERSVKTGRSRE